MKTIVCHGDSLTEGDEIARNYTWPVLVENKISINFINSGIGGDTSGGMLVGKGICFLFHLFHHDAGLTSISKPSSLGSPPTDRT